MLVEDFIGDPGKFVTQSLAINFRETLATMALKKTSQNIVQQFARIDCLKIQCCFTARLELQHALPKKAIGTVAIDAETAGA